MSNPSSPVAAPVSGSERIAALDTLRGVAVLGILALNIWGFALPVTAYENPAAMGPLRGVDYAAWYATFVLGDYKFVTLFTLMFGAGVWLMSERARLGGHDMAWLHRRRMLWLALIGLAHAYLIWHGDILFPYAVYGWIIFHARDLAPGRQLAWGAALIGLGAVVAMAQFAGSELPSAAAQAAASGQPGIGAGSALPSAFTGGWLEQMPARAELAFDIQLAAFLTESAPRLMGTMMIGMGLLRLGVLSGRSPAVLYAALTLFGFGIGVPMEAAGVTYAEARQWDAGALYGWGHQIHYWASLMVASGWVGLTLLICRTGLFGAARRALAAVGRMALTNYLMQSVICTLIFYGHGLGLFGQLGRAALLGVVVGVWGIQLVVSPLWLARFRFGPAEWLWRSLTYGRPQRLRGKPGIGG